MFTIFTDGSSKGNPGAGGWAAILVSDTTVSEYGGREERTTNNRMELTGAIQGAKRISKDTPATIIVDSKYVANGITSWVFSWQKNNWKSSTKEDVLNQDLWKLLITETQGKKIEWKVVAGHAGIAGNERCDVIATGFADGEKPALFSGPRVQYGITNILSLSGGQSASSNKGKKAYSYVSRVGGVIQTHTTWDECKARVQGKTNALFRKTLSKDDEVAIIESWK